MADFEDDSSLLAIVLDVSPPALAHLAATPGLSLQSLLEQLLTFVNAFTLLNDANRLAVFAAGASGCHLAYCSPSCLPPSAAAPLAAPGTPSAAVLEGLREAATAAAAAALAEQPGGAASGSSQMSAALSRTLCFLNSQHRQAVAAAGGALAGGGTTAAVAGLGSAQRRQQPARLLCLAAAPDVPSQYIAVMNAIFSAQAAHLTGGIYLKPSQPQALIQYLNSVFAVDAGTRRLLRMPGTARVDFRASCFCHKRQIDLGFVCSACLSIFCEQLPACTTCGTDFQAGVGKKS